MNHRYIMDRNTIRTIIFSFALIVVSEAYKGGAPESECETMTPQHGVDPQTSEFPYSLTATKKGKQILITLKTKTETDSFKGFLMQVRNTEGKPIGSFNVPANAKTVKCDSNEKSALTHNSNKEKKEIKATWTAPKDFTGQVYPIVTVARNGGEYWVGHKSATITI